MLIPYKREPNLIILFIINSLLVQLQWFISCIENMIFVRTYGRAWRNYSHILIFRISTIKYYYTLKSKVAWYRFFYIRMLIFYWINKYYHCLRDWRDSSWSTPFGKHSHKTGDWQKLGYARQLVFRPPSRYPKFRKLCDVIEQWKNSRFSAWLSEKSVRLSLVKPSTRKGIFKEPCVFSELVS